MAQQRVALFDGARYRCRRIADGVPAHHRGEDHAELTRHGCIGALFFGEGGDAALSFSVQFHIGLRQPYDLALGIADPLALADHRAGHPCELQLHGRGFALGTFDTVQAHQPGECRAGGGIRVELAEYVVQQGPQVAHRFQRDLDHLHGRVSSGKIGLQALAGDRVLDQCQRRTGVGQHIGQALDLEAIGGHTVVSH